MDVGDIVRTERNLLGVIVQFFPGLAGKAWYVEVVTPRQHRLHRTSCWEKHLTVLEPMP